MTTSFGLTAKLPRNWNMPEWGARPSGPTRWTMPSLWYRFEFPAKNPLITFLALDSNMPFRGWQQEPWHGTSP